MASQTEIINRALIKLGSERIDDISDRVKSAQIMSEIWDTCRRAELRKRNWSFALKRDVLAALGDAPAWGYGMACQLPADFLRLVQANDFYITPSLVDYRDSDDSPYAIEGQQLLSDFSAPLKIRYVRDINEPGLFDPLFVEVLACKLAFEACYAITQSRQGQEVAMQDYKQAVRDASLTGAVEKPPQGLPDNSWLLGRL